MAKTMIHENNLPKYLWTEAVNTTCYVQNKIYIRPIINKTSYGLFKGRKVSISYFHQLGCTCYILNNKVYLNKFDAKAQKGIFLGYSEAQRYTRRITLKPIWLKSPYTLNLRTKCLKVKLQS